MHRHAIMDAFKLIFFSFSSRRRNFPKETMNLVIQNLRAVRVVTRR